MAPKQTKSSLPGFSAPVASELWTSLPERGMAPLRLGLAQETSKAQLVERHRVLRVFGGRGCETFLGSLLEKHLSPALCRAVAEEARPAQLEALAGSSGEPEGDEARARRDSRGGEPRRPAMCHRP